MDRIMGKERDLQMMNDTRQSPALLTFEVQGERFEVSGAVHAQLPELCVGLLLCGGRLKDAKPVVAISMEEDGLHAVLDEKLLPAISREERLFLAPVFPHLPPTQLINEWQETDTVILLGEKGRFCFEDARFENAVYKAVGYARLNAWGHCALLCEKNITVDDVLLCAYGGIQVIATRAGVTEDAGLLAKKLGMLVSSTAQR